MRPARPAVLAFLVALGCGDSQSGDGPPSAQPPAELPRVAFSPTADDELPPAVLGENDDALQGTGARYVSGDTLTLGYVAEPEGDGPFPALIVVHEWDGLKNRVRRLADDLAAEGYVTLAVDLFKGQTGETPDENMALVQQAQADAEAMVANLDAALAYLRRRQDVTGRVGVMGWCFGGGVALSYGLDGDNHEATAIFYGRLVTDPEALAALDHEVYGTFAGLDEGPSPEQVADFEAALRSAGVENDIHVYDDVNHGFWLWVDGNPEVRTAPALDAWRRLKAYLNRTLRSDG